MKDLMLLLLIVFTSLGSYAQSFKEHIVAGVHVDTPVEWVVSGNELPDGGLMMMAMKEYDYPSIQFMRQPKAIFANKEVAMETMQAMLHANKQLYGEVYKKSDRINVHCMDRAACQQDFFSKKGDADVVFRFTTFCTDKYTYVMYILAPTKYIDKAQKIASPIINSIWVEKDISRRNITAPKSPTRPHNNKKLTSSEGWNAATATYTSGEHALIWILNTEFSWSKLPTMPSDGIFGVREIETGTVAYLAGQKHEGAVENDIWEQENDFRTNFRASIPSTTKILTEKRTYLSGKKALFTKTSMSINGIELLAFQYAFVHQGYIMNINVMVQKEMEDVLKEMNVSVEDVFFSGLRFL